MTTPRLNRQMTLEAPQSVSDGMGGWTEGWVVLGTVWAEVKARTGRARDGETGPLARNSMRIVLRSAPVGSPERPQAGQRLREGTRVFAIDAVNDLDAAGRFLTCFATEEVAA